MIEDRNCEFLHPRWRAQGREELPLPTNHTNRHEWGPAPEPAFSEHDAGQEWDWKLSRAPMNRGAAQQATFMMLDTLREGRTCQVLALCSLFVVGGPVHRCISVSIGG